MWIISGAVGSAVAAGAAAVGSAALAGAAAVGSGIAATAGAVGSGIAATAGAIGSGAAAIGSSALAGVKAIGATAPGWIKTAGASVKSLYGSVQSGFGLGTKLNSFMANSKTFGTLQSGISSFKGSKFYQVGSKIYDTYGKVSKGVQAVNRLFGGVGGTARAYMGQDIQSNYQGMISNTIRANQYNATLLSNMAQDNLATDNYNRRLNRDMMRQQLSASDLMSAASGAREDSQTSLYNKIDNTQTALLGLNIQARESVNRYLRAEDTAHLAYIQGNAEVERLTFEAKAAQKQSMQGLAKGAGELAGDGTLNEWKDKALDWGKDILFGNDDLESPVEMPSFDAPSVLSKNIGDSFYNPVGAKYGNILNFGDN